MLSLTRSQSTKNPTKILCSTLLPNTVSHVPKPSKFPSEIIFPYKPNSKRDMRNEVPLQTLIYHNENLTTIARNHNKLKENDDEGDNFAARFFTNSIKRFDKDYTKEVKEKLIEEYKKENPDAFVSLFFL